jgi:hypothetical protein
MVTREITQFGLTTPEGRNGHAKNTNQTEPDNYPTGLKPAE